MPIVLVLAHLTFNRVEPISIPVQPVASHCLEHGGPEPQMRGAVSFTRDWRQARPAAQGFGPLPCLVREWYCQCVSGTYQVVVGDRGRLVIPADLRERAGLVEGTTLIMLETPTGLVLLTRPQLQELVRTDLAGSDLVGELLAERRAEAAAEDVA